MSDDCFHCREFSRSRVLHNAVAQAGRGLPNIEPGMPMPAGTGLSRRTFLSATAGLAITVFGANALRPEALDEGIAEAAAAAPNGRVLVSIFLEGGADPLSLLAPVADGRYRQLRSRIALPVTAGVAYAKSPTLRWHPAAASFAKLDVAGKLGVLPGIGYSMPDFSHFTSRHYWEVGAHDTGLATGWLGRFLDRNGDPNNPIQGLSFDYTLQPALAAAAAPTASINVPETFRLQTHPLVQERALDAIIGIGAAHSRAKGTIREAALTGAGTAALDRKIAPAKTGALPSLYPKSGDPFPKRLASLAQFLSDGFPIRCAALVAPGNYDTHANQAAVDNDLKLTCDSLLAFQLDLEARGLADRVLTHVWTEFGRRAQDNASRGTDHGAAGIGFLIGTNARPGLLSEYPSLTNLDERGNLRPTVDYRGVYRGLLEQWFQADPADVIPGAAAFAAPALLG
jgi:uncharacterized protein (DUF1501 family)